MKVIIDGIEYVPAIALSADANVYDRALAAPIRWSCDFKDGEITVAEYLEKLLVSVWVQHESFYGSHPFGNSGWKHCLVSSLMSCGYIPGTFEVDENNNDDIVEQIYNRVYADRLILELIQYAFCRQGKEAIA